MEDSPIPSPSLLPMPPLPQCLKKLLLKEHLTEIETNRTLKSLIQPEYERSLKGNDIANEDNYINMEKYKIVGKHDRNTRSETPELDVPKETVDKELSWKGNIGAAIGHLKNEIVSHFIPFLSIVQFFKDTKDCSSYNRIVLIIYLLHSAINFQIR